MSTCDLDEVIRAHIQKAQGLVDHASVMRVHERAYAFGAYIVSYSPITSYSPVGEYRLSVESPKGVLLVCCEFPQRIPKRPDLDPVYGIYETAQRRCQEAEDARRCENLREALNPPKPGEITEVNEPYTLPDFGFSNFPWWR